MDFPFKQERAKLTSYEMSPEAEARLNALQARLDAAGCVDLHISWNHESLASGKLSLDDVVNGVCAGFEALLDGETTVMEAFDDGAGYLADITPAPALPAEMERLIASVTL